MKREYVTPEISITNFDVSDNTNYVTISANYGFAKKNSFSQVTHLNSQFKKLKGSVQHIGKARQSLFYVILGENYINFKKK